jgi:hypothetical protein
MREGGLPSGFKMEVLSDFKPMFRYKIRIDIVRVAGRQGDKSLIISLALSVKSLTILQTQVLDGLVDKGC